MAIMEQPWEYSAAHNCLLYRFISPLPPQINLGTAAEFRVNFSDGGIAANGTIIMLQGQRFIIDNDATVPDGYRIKFDGLTDVERAQWLFNTLQLNIFFDPSVVNINIFGNVISIQYYQLGVQSNWVFDNSGIAEINIYPIDGTDTIQYKDIKYVFSIYEDRTLQSLPPIKLVEDKTLPLILKYNTEFVPDRIESINQYIDIQKEVKDLVKTSLPNIYSPIFTPIADPNFRKQIFLRVGASYKDSCNNVNVGAEISNNTWIYNCLFQSKTNIGTNDLMAPYVIGLKPLLIKKRYEICRNSSMFVWSVCDHNSLSVFYYDSSNNFIESANYEYGYNVKGTLPTYMNVGGFGHSIPSNATYYILRYLNRDAQTAHEVRIDLISCECIAGEFIFLFDLGGYGTILMDKAIKQDILVESEVIDSYLGCTITSLFKGGRSIVNKETESVWTFEKVIDIDTEEELEYIAQFQRSQSFYMKQFIEASELYAYFKVIPENITLTVKEDGKRSKLTFTIRFNQSYKSHPQNEGLLN